MHSFHAFFSGIQGRLRVAGILMLLCSGQWLPAQIRPEAVETRLRELALRQPGLVVADTLGRSREGRPIWYMRIGMKPVEEKPALAIVSGLDPTAPAGPAMALRIADDLLHRAGEDDLSALLRRVCFYIIPMASPDAFAAQPGPTGTPAGNRAPGDNDRDGLSDEDPAEDLNGDGWITWMRVADPNGGWLPHPAFPQVMIPADPARGLRGTHRLYPEGRDDDHDRTWNEDGLTGVNMNHNFPYDFEWFHAAHGAWPASEPETRALLDFLYDRSHVWGVFCLGTEDNLSTPWNGTYAHDPRNAAQIGEQDAGMYRLVAGLFREITGRDQDIYSEPLSGSFTDWAAFHYGRFAFASPCLWFSPQAVTPPSAAAAHLQALGPAAAAPLALPWTPCTHPDFPGKTVEIGGLLPLATTHFPDSLVDSLTQQHMRFVIRLGEMLPQLSLTITETETAGEGITRIRAEIANTGSLPTHTRLGSQTRWVQKIRVRILPARGQQLMAGQAQTLIAEPLAPGETRSFTWLVWGSGEVQIEAGAPHCGMDRKTLSLQP